MRWLIPLVELAGVTEHTGGVGRRYAAVLPEIADSGVEVIVALYPDTPVRSDSRDPEGVPVLVDRRFAWLPSFLRPIVRAYLFRRLARRLQPDLVFAPEWLGAGAFVPKHTPVVTNLVTGVEIMAEIERSVGAPVALPRRVQIALQGTLERKQIMRSAWSIGCSTAIVTWYRKRLGHDFPTSVVRNCIDVEHVRQRSMLADLPAGWPRAAMIMLHAGRVEVRKGAHTSILAFNLLAQRFPDLVLVLAGGRGYELPEWGKSGIESLIDPSVRDRVVFLGDVRSDSLYRAMAVSTVCVVPSLWEAFGNIALEAKASRVPLVVTSGSGFDDFCHDAVDSRVVPPGDANELARVVAQLLEDDEGRSILVDAASSQVSHFSASTVAVDLRREIENVGRG